jgi:transcriptional regulator with XRE-family HTH domain
MDPMSAASVEVPSFGQLLRSTRGARRLSQLQLAVEADVSQRHLSFLESGRALPSREMVLQLARALDLPLRERNRLLVSAGFAGLYPTRRLEAGDMQPVRAALELLLAHHEPYPAIVVDRAWNLFMANAAVPKVFGAMGDLDQMFRRVCGERPPNVLEILFHPDGVQPYIRNFAEVAVPLLVRTAREALEHPHVQSVLDRVLDYPTVPALAKPRPVAQHEPAPRASDRVLRRRSPPRAVLDDDHIRHPARRHHRRAARRGVLPRRRRERGTPARAGRARLIGSIRC